MFCSVRGSVYIRADRSDSFSVDVLATISRLFTKGNLCELKSRRPGSSDNALLSIQACQATARPTVSSLNDRGAARSNHLPCAQFHHVCYSRRRDCVGL